MPIVLPIMTPHVHLQEGTSGRGNMRTGQERMLAFKVAWPLVEDFIKEVFGTFARSVPVALPGMPYFYADDYSFAAIGTDRENNDFQFAKVAIVFKTLPFGPEDPDFPWISVKFQAAGKSFPAPEGAYKFNTGDSALDAYPVPPGALFMVETGLQITVHRVHFDMYFENLDIINSVVNCINSEDLRMFNYSEKKVLCTGVESSENYWVMDEQAIDLVFSLQVSRGDSDEESENPRWDKVIHPKQGAGWREIVNGDDNPPFRLADMNQIFDIA